MGKDSIDLLEELDSICKIHTLKRGDIDNLMIEFARRILVTLRIERMSVWLFNKDMDAIVSMGEYDLPTQTFSKEQVLIKEKYPLYIKAINENEILLVPNVYRHEGTKELEKDYMLPNKVISLMDIPLRLEGKLIGVMCFEKTGTLERIFAKDEQVFALSVAIVFASNLEARHRRAVQHKLDRELQEKEILVKEMHHRVKNNLAVVASLINLQGGKSKDEYHKMLFDDCKNKVLTIAGIHELVYKSDVFSDINLYDYFSNLLPKLESFYRTETNNITLRYQIDPILLHMEQALPLSLIVNEVLTNAYKHAFTEASSGSINVSLNVKNEKIVLAISDTGKGFSESDIKNDSLGIEIIKGLTRWRIQLSKPQ
jgi:two-component sensor histidine kinase